MKKIYFGLMATIAVLAAIFAAGCVQPTPPVQNTVGILYTKGVGPMPSLLATGDIDAYIAWQPIVEVGPLTGIGRVVTYSKDLPPPGTWVHHPCCVLVSRDDLKARNPALVDAMGTATILATNYINDHPDETAEITADWLAGKGNFTYGNVSVSSVEVLEHAIPTVEFSNDPSESWVNGTLLFVDALNNLSALKGSLANVSHERAEGLLFDYSTYANATKQIETGSITVPAAEPGQVGVGYLMSDHHAALFVAVKKWEYFNSTYGIALRPQDPAASKPELVDLIVGGKKVATLKLVPADAGPGLMQLAAINSVQLAYVGNPPAISAIDQGTPVHILMSVNKEGSGVVASSKSPATDWNSLVQWAKDRSASGKPLRVAAPGKGSIQDILIRSAFRASGMNVQEVQI
jgi:ABC-type nitrate/sulfonate/bicarbonate transport system substrate-binding protein